VNRQTLILATLTTILVSLGFVFFARDFIYQGVVLPILYGVWLANLVINSIDQSFLWLTAVFVFLILLLRGLSLRPARLPRTAENRLEVVEKGRVAFWAAKMVLGSRGEYSRRYFNLELKKLVLGTLGQRENLTPREVEEGLRSGAIMLPPALENYAKSWAEECYAPQPGVWQRLLDWLSWKRKPAAGLDMREVSRLVDLLEDQLEIRRAQSGQPELPLDNKRSIPN